MLYDERGKHGLHSVPWAAVTGGYVSVDQRSVFLFLKKYFST